MARFKKPEYPALDDIVSKLQSIVSDPTKAATTVVEVVEALRLRDVALTDTVTTATTLQETNDDLVQANSKLFLAVGQDNSEPVQTVGAITDVDTQLEEFVEGV